jgi:H+-translocating NAD(P) transhydrogenase subunit beta
VSELLYAVAAVAFITGLKRLSTPVTARSGNALAAAGMLLAVVVTLVAIDVIEPWVVAAGLVVGATLGAVTAERVAMTAMPQLVAALNGSGGLASALVAGAEVAAGDGRGLADDTVVAVLLSIAIGTVTFTGSLLAFGKLQGIVTERPVVYPARAVVGVVAAGIMAAAGTAAVLSGDPRAFMALAVVGLAAGVLLVLPIGGADMPVVISLLNSFSGLAAAAAGFAIGNSVLVIGGALVGAAGFVLTVQMCEAMNRKLSNVLFGALGATTAGATGDHAAVRSTTPDDVAVGLAYADAVLFVPGYGLAAARAQHALRSLADLLTERGVEVGYAIHPVAGRMPGHMNVLLAEADVPYDQLLDLEVANDRMARTDVVVVVGANDVVNTSARDDPASPIHGMPILEVDEAGSVIVIKRSLSPGFAGIDNPLFSHERTQLLFADARQALEELAAAVEEQ